MDAACIKTRDINQMKHAAIRTPSPLGLNIIDHKAVICYLVKFINNPRSQEEAYLINLALKTPDMVTNNSTDRFYDMLREAMTRQLIFTKLSQIYLSLIEEYKTTKELLIMLNTNKLLDIQDLGGDEIMLAHNTIHNINNRRKLYRFSQIINKWCRDNNLKELLFEINFELECYQMGKLNEQITDDMKNNSCFLY